MKNTTKNNIVKSFVVIFPVIMLAGLATIVNADTILLTSSEGSFPEKIADPGKYIKGFYGIGVGIAGVLAAIMIVIGGIEYITSAANPSGRTEANKRIWAAVGGLLIALLSWIILNTINPNLLKFNISLDTTGGVVSDGSSEKAAAIKTSTEKLNTLEGQYGEAKTALTNALKELAEAEKAANSTETLSEGGKILLGEKVDEARKKVQLLADKKSELGRDINNTNSALQAMILQDATDFLAPGSAGATGGPLISQYYGDSERERAFRAILKKDGIEINRSNPCTSSTSKNCTSVAGLPDGAINRLLKFNKSCGGCVKQLNAGSEQGPHKTHEPGAPIVDIDPNPEINLALTGNSINPADGTKITTIEGDIFTFEKKGGNSTGDHWHTVLVGSSEKPTPMKSLYSDCLFYKTCTQ